MTSETILTEEQVAEIWKVSNKPFGDDFKLSHYFFAWNIVAAMLDSPEIQSLRKDAERYRWLRDMIENQDLVIAKVGSWSLDSWSGDDPDHYIDAAMEQQK